ncbi:hypothetical protein [Thiocapsa sp.]
MKKLGLVVKQKKRFVLTTDERLSNPVDDDEARVGQAASGCSS